MYIHVLSQENNADIQCLTARVETVADTDATRVETVADTDATRVETVADTDATRVETVADTDATRVETVADTDAHRGTAFSHCCYCCWTHRPAEMAS